MNKFFVNPLKFFGTIWAYRKLILDLIKREVTTKYKGSFFGLFWSLVTPILMLAVYTFVFSFVFNARWGGDGNGSKIEFALLLFSGLMIFNLFAECIGRAPGLIIENSSYVKKIVFPLEVLPLVILGTAITQFLFSFTVWVFFYFLFIGELNFYIFLLPVVLTPFLVLLSGMTMVLSAIGVYVRDISQIISIIITMTLFLSPIFYPASALPARFQILFTLNPLTIPIEGIREVLYFGEFTLLTPLIYYSVIALCVQIFGFLIFQKLRNGFADVV